MHLNRGPPKLIFLNFASDFISGDKLGTIHKTVEQKKS